MPTEEINSHISLRKLVFRTDRENIENHKQLKCRIVEPSPDGYTTLQFVILLKDGENSMQKPKENGV